MTHDDLVTKVAEVIRGHLSVSPYYASEMARAAIAAVAEVIKEPTPGMLQAVGLFTDISGEERDVWRAMLAASPLAPGETSK